MELIACPSFLIRFDFIKVMPLLAAAAAVTNVYSIKSILFFDHT
jgi:hypothetical protein